LRIIPRLDVKYPNVVKGVRLEGFRVVGNPIAISSRYEQDGADEILYQDVVASLYERNNILEMVKDSANELAIPLSVGGGLRSVDDVRTALRFGADRVVLNTSAIKNPRIINDVVQVFGSQGLVIGIESVSVGPKSWEALVNCGRDRTGLDVIEWAQEVEEKGAGELLITSVDRDGTYQGLDLDLLGAVREKCSLPIVIHGGAKSVEDFRHAWDAGASGVAAASIFHHERLTINTLKGKLLDVGIPVRTSN